MVVASGSRFQPARREGITDMRYFVTGHEMLLYLSGDREEHKEEFTACWYAGLLNL